MNQNGERRLVGVRVAACLAMIAGGVTPVMGQDKALPVPPEPTKTAQPTPGGPKFNPRTNPALNKGNQPKANPAAQPNPGRPSQPGANGTGNKPAGGGDGEKEHAEVPKIDAGDGLVEFSGFAEPLELSSLVEIVGATLDINIYTDGELRGSIVFNAPVKVKKEKLLDMLRAWLELYGYAIIYDERTDFYAVMPANKVPVDFNDKLSTRVWPMDGIRPSSLKTVIDGVVGAASSTVVGGGAGAANRGRNPGNPQPMPEDGGQPNPGAPQTTSTNTGGRITYHDELGMIIAVDTHRRLDQIDEVLKRVKAEYQEITIQEFALTVVSPSVAKTRILEMLGQAPQQANQNRNRGYDEYGNPIQQQPQQNTAKTTIDNLAERLTVAPNGNSLFFRGKKNEGDLVKHLVELIDQPSKLEPWTYYVGPAAKAVADIARQRGLGEVTVIQSMDERRMAANAGYYYYDGGYRGNQQQQQATNISGGSVMVVDEGRGQIIYYATEKLHEEFWKLLEQIDPENEAVVMREYRLVHAKAKTVANLVLGLIQNRTIESGNGNDLLPSTNSGGGRNQPPTVVFNGPDIYGRGGNNDLSISGKDSYVLADEDNNQVIVKAPVKEQSYYKELIRRLDLPRPQIYVDAQIVAVTGSDTFRLAFETQLINANGTGGVVNTNFGLSSFATNGTLNNRKVVSTGLKGLTAALIKSDQVPVVINALQTVTDAKVLSSPQLLVDANAKESSVESNDSQPTQTRTLGNNGNQDAIGFGGYEKAGTKLVVKEPRVGTGDTVQMTVEVELSSFTGSATDTLPPPKSENNIKSQVQVPANMTCVIGGVVVDSRRNTVTKIPLLGDIPLLGALFSDQGHTDTKTTLYVFLTPRVLRSATFDDVPLITSGPMKTVGLDPRTPEFKPVLVDFVSVTENPGGAPTVTVKPGAEKAKDMPAEAPKAGESKATEGKPAESKPVEAKPEGSK